MKTLSKAFLQQRSLITLTKASSPFKNLLPIDPKSLARRDAHFAARPLVVNTAKQQGQNGFIYSVFPCSGSM
jgi:hypothetical protein